MLPDQLLALTLFAIAGSFTPGPNNTIAAVTGANHGLRAGLPHIVGVPLGFASMLLAAAGGVAALLLAVPGLTSVIKWIGVGYLLLLAWTLARSAAGSSAAATGPFRLPLSVAQSALFQYLNPKAWMLAAATAGTFLAGDHPCLRATQVSMVFALAAAASLVVWTWLGAALRRWLAVGQRLRLFNLLMALLLAATALWMAVMPVR